MNPEEAPRIPVISLDYAFVNTELETDMVNIRVMVQKPEDPVASIMVIHKGPRRTSTQRWSSTWTFGAQRTSS